MVTDLANGGTASAIGKSSASRRNLVFSGGTLAYSGPAKAIDRGYSVQGTGIGPSSAQSTWRSAETLTASTDSGFAKTGPAKLTYTGTGTNELSGGAFPGYNVLNGTVVFDGSAGSQVNHSQNEFWVGSSPTTASALVLSNTTLNIG